MRASGGGTGPSSIKHAESISVASGSVLATKDVGKKCTMTSTVSEIEKSHIGIARTVSKNTAESGLGGSIDLEQRTP